MTDDEMIRAVDKLAVPENIRGIIKCLLMHAPAKVGEDALKEFGIVWQFDDPELAYVYDALLRNNEKVAAIKLYRTRRGGSLKECKDAIDRYEEGIR